MDSLLMHRLDGTASLDTTGLKTTIDNEMAEYSRNSSSFDTNLISSTRTKLAQLNDTIMGFGKDIDADLRQKRDTAETKINTVKVDISKLEKVINQEIKRRCDNFKILKATFEDRIHTVQDKLEGAFSEKLDQLQTLEESLRKRIDTVERQFTSDREKIVKDMEDKNLTIAKELTLISTAFESEEAARIDRDLELSKRIADIEAKLDTYSSSDRHYGEQKFDQLRSALDEAKKLRSASDEQFQNFILRDIAQIKKDLVTECKCREDADDAMVQGLNSYTVCLQDSLKFIEDA